jgi:hypothetical protein
MFHLPDLLVAQLEAVPVSTKIVILLGYKQNAIDLGSAAKQARFRIWYIINLVENSASRAVSYGILDIGSTCPEFTLNLGSNYYQLYSVGETEQSVALRCCLNCPSFGLLFYTDYLVLRL